MVGKSEVAEVLLRSCVSICSVVLRRGEDRVGETEIEVEAGLRCYVNMDKYMSRGRALTAARSPSTSSFFDRP